MFVGQSALAQQVADAPGVSRDQPNDGIFVRVGDRFMVPYTAKIPGTDVEFEMIPVPSGTFLMGSPPDEPNRKSDEGPQIEVRVAPMWVGKFEVRQSEYREYELLYEVFVEIESHGGPITTSETDAVTAPTPLYSRDAIYEWGDAPELPAVSMTQFAAQQYTKWLSAITKCQYRLPTEAEWEYACRAGTNTAFSWSGNLDAADEYAWHFDNAEDGYSRGGLKKPNAFGLYDMHGNIGEWTVNAYTKEGYRWLKNKQPVDAVAAVRWPETSTSCVVRGGTWEFDLENLRSAARLESIDDEWKDGDANFPCSPWWFTSDPARSIGFRLFCSYEPLDGETIAKFWDHTSPEVKAYVRQLVQATRGRIGVLDEHLLPATSEYRKQRAEWQKQREKRRRLLRNSRPD
jgi:formylglycine-generating enzyme required for sulfatase activity